MRGSIVSALAAGTYLVVTAAGVPPDLSAQDVEMRGRETGKRPPAAYYERLAQDPDAYQFQRVWKGFARRVRERRTELVRAGDFRNLNAHLSGVQASVAAAQASGAAVAGSFSFPVLLGLFNDSTHSTLPDSITLDNTLFSTAAAPPYSIPTYYDELSNGLLTVGGDIVNWVTVANASTWYEGTNNGLDPSTDHTGDFIEELLVAADANIDFSQYDNDGDGYVDLVAILHPLQDGACQGSSHIWAHRWVYRAWKGAPFTTNDGGVLVDDYVIQSAVGGPNTGCDATQNMAIGTMVHELGHGILGLPDLYDTGQASQGIGHWGLMGSGNYNTPASPAHLSAWSKDQVGWITVQAVTPGSDTTRHVLNPIVTSDAALRIDLAGTTEYFLLENRQWLGSDANLRGEGLLVWHVAPDVIDQYRPWNEVNAHTPHGVKLEQADGLDQLGLYTTNRGDGGDPYPGSSSNAEFGPATFPDTRLNDGSVTALRVDSITVNGDDVAFRISVGLAPVVIQSDTLDAGVMGASYADTLEATGGTGGYTWARTGGDNIPAGLVLDSASGAISGAPEEEGTFEIVCEAVSGALSSTDTVTVIVTRPDLLLDNVVHHLLSPVQVLSEDEQRYLDIIGNKNGAFDIGDFRAYLQYTGAAPAGLSADLIERAAGKEGGR
ncbi:MAG: M6 family metalloprotease domain-containing protein [Gemmatimonadetes bacterium]|nr:M6 family metalloprotease domain-containing protein [Gemmatimonadota bacterium]NIO32360.1 M6 family metalloprotease domain-containing protein [Gemmatimonadota bacterium]